MRRIFISLFLFLSLFLIGSCTDKEPSSAAEKITFIVTATGYVPQPPSDYPPTPPVGQAVCYQWDPRCPDDPACNGDDYEYARRPVSVEFKPEIRIYPVGSDAYQLAALETGEPDDTVYFGRTPYDTVCTDALQATFESDANYEFTVTANGSKVVGLFNKKSYLDTSLYWRDGAILKVDAYINDVLWKSFTETEAGLGGLTVIVPLD